MYEYRTIVKNIKALPILGKEGRLMCGVDNEYMYFYKEEKQKRNTRKGEITKEFEEFIKLYRTINNNGSYDERLIVKYSDIIKDYSKEGDIILDCFAGSFTTAVACIETGRNYICIEKEAKYVEIGKKRVANTTPPLFTI